MKDCLSIQCHLRDVQSIICVWRKKLLLLSRINFLHVLIPVSAVWWSCALGLGHVVAPHTMPHPGRLFATRAIFCEP